MDELIQINLIAMGEIVRLNS